MKILKGKRLTSFLICVMILFSSLTGLTATAKNVEKEKVYKPVDLIIVIDRSGSMLYSDKSRSALDAVRMLINMMPANDSRVGVVAFNEKSSIVTTAADGSGQLVPLKDINDAVTVKKKVSEIVYSGDTGIGNALIAATDLLEKNKSADRDRAIIMFTDGLNDFGKNELALSKCEENEADALLWAKKNDCPIYTAGYDYIQSDGTSSMGTNGEGLKKLKNIADSTDGKFRKIKNIDEIEQLLIEFLADVFDLNYKTVATIPGDGGVHECAIPVSPSVVEANIRIVGGNEDSIAQGEIRLYDPDGKEMELKNSGNVRFDVDANAASIKVTLPKIGEWRLIVKGIEGDDIHVGLLEHFKMNLTSQLTYPSGNPDGIAYSKDEIGIKTWLTYDGVDIDNEAIYDAVKSATAVCVPRANSDDKKIVNLQRDGLSFTGKFTIPQDCYYDITIRLEWDTVYREDTLEVRSENKPPQLAGDIPEVKVNKKKTVSIDNIYQYIQDEENDKITVSVVSLTSPDVATIAVNGDSLSVTGNKWSSTLVTIAYSDAQGNVIETSFKVKVNDPVAIAMIIITIILIVAFVLFMMWYTVEKSKKITGELYLISMTFDTSADEDGNVFRFDFTDDPNEVIVDPNAIMIPMKSFYKRRENRNVNALLGKIRDMFRLSEEGTDGGLIRELFGKQTIKTLFRGSEKTKICGSVTGDTFSIKLSKKAIYLRANRSNKKTIVQNNGDLVLEFKERERRGNKNAVVIVLKYVTKTTRLPKAGKTKKHKR